MVCGTVSNARDSHRVLLEFRYTPVELRNGYTNRTLRIDLSKNSVEVQPVTQRMKDLWIGGKGFGLWLMFQEITPVTRWDSEENPICVSPGPLSGTTSFPGSGKSIVTTISPLTSSIMDCNVGGYFGPYLKFAGFDALTLIGKAKDEIIVVIDAVKKTVTIEQAPNERLDSHKLANELTERYADDEMDKRNISVVSAGTAADHVRMGILNFSFWDWRRNEARLKQAGRGGVGTVFRQKKLTALVVKTKEVLPTWNISLNKVTDWTTSQIEPKRETPRKLVREIIQKWRADPDYVIEMMQDIQERERYLSQSALQELSLRIGVPESQLYHIATFYKAFSLKPRGEIVVQVCVGTACHVKGSEKILSSFERILKCQRGETTQDRRFSLEAVGCLGACAIAPVVKIGDEIIGGVQSRDVGRLIQRAKKRLEERKIQQRIRQGGSHA